MITFWQVVVFMVVGVAVVVHVILILEKGLSLNPWAADRRAFRRQQRRTRMRVAELIERGYGVSDARAMAATELKLQARETTETLIREKIE